VQELKEYLSLIPWLHPEKHVQEHASSIFGHFHGFSGYAILAASFRKGGEVLRKGKSLRLFDLLSERYQ